MNTFDLTLDLSKQVSMEPLRLRQGDKSGTTVRATVYDHGELVSGSYTARIAMRHPGTGATYYRETGTFSNGVATFTIDEQYAATVTGRTTGYVQLLQGSTVIASTADFPVVILRDATEGAVPGEVYDSAIEDALAELDEATGRISVMVQEQVAEELAAHPEWTTTVTDGSVTDAKLVQTGGILSRVDRLMYRLDNLLTGDTGEQEVAVVADAAATPVAGLSVYGRSVQDGTPTPSAPVAIQSVEGNLWGYERSGYINTSGTFSPSSTNALCYGVPCKVGDKYIFQTNAVVGGVQARVVGADGTMVQNIAMTNNVSTKTFTTNYDGTLYVWFNDPSLNGTEAAARAFEPRMFLGSVALPYVPYGHAGLWAQGRNFAQCRNFTRSTNGVTFTVGDDGTINVAGTATANAQFNLAARVDSTAYLLPDGSYTLTGCPTGGSATTYELTLNVNPGGELRMRDFGSGASYTFEDGAGMLGCGLYIMVRSGQTVDLTFRPMLARGSTATPYQPYVESVTPVPLAGHVLRSLPDGTRDEVTVDERGHAVLVQRVGEVTLDGSESWVVENGGARASCPLPSPAIGPSDNTRTANLWCNRFVASSPNATWTGTTAGISISTTNLVVMISDGTRAMSASSFKTWLAENPVTLQYPLATPVTHDLGTVDPVALTSPDATLQAVSGIATTFRADYERDLNVTLARLEAAIATLA